MGVFRQKEEIRGGLRQVQREKSENGGRFWRERKRERGLKQNRGEMKQAEGGWGSWQ